MKATFRVYPYRNAARPNLKWVVRWKDDAGKPRIQTFEKKLEAETFSQQRNTEILNQGREALTFPTWLRVMAERCDRQLREQGATIQEATDHYLAVLAERKSSKPIWAVVLEFLETKEREGVSRKYVLRSRSLLRKFSDFVNGKLISEVTAADGTAWIHTLEVGPVSRNNFRLYLISFFNFAIAQGYCSKNPAREIGKARVVESEVGILTVDQLASLLAASDPYTLPFFAIGAFAGVRSAELKRLDWSDVKLDQGYIQISARKAKTARRRLIEIQPCLDAWLRPIAKPSGRIFPTQIDDRMQKQRERMGLQWPQNALRHSFASYYLAHFQDAPKLALQMGHTGCDMIFKHYREIVSRQEALRYWNLFPAEPERILERAIENIVQLPGRVRDHFGKYVDETPLPKVYAKSKREYAAQYGVSRATIQKWCHMGRPLDDPEAMAAERKPRYSQSLRYYAKVYGKGLRTVTRWAQAGWPLDDEAGIKQYLASRKFGQRGKVNIPANKALQLLPLPVSETSDKTVTVKFSRVG